MLKKEDKMKEINYKGTVIKKLLKDQLLVEIIDTKENKNNKHNLQLVVNNGSNSEYKIGKILMVGTQETIKEKDQVSNKIFKEGEIILFKNFGNHSLGEENPNIYLINFSEVIGIVKETAEENLQRKK